MWATVQIILIALGLLLAYTGNEISIPVRFYAGIGCLGLALGALGLFETLAPASFDEMGGALLEQLYDPR